MSTATALIGRTLAGRFQITGFLGEGAMAAVYRGVQKTGQPRDVAIKVMHAHLARDPSFVRRFRREARAASRLKHPNSVQILDYGVDKDTVYIAMELLAGKDLFDTLVAERQLAEARAARIVIQVCDALTAAHEQGIVHRDLKPENIMLLPSADGEDRIKVLDFGIAKILDTEAKDSGDAPPVSEMASSVLTKVGVIVGTPEYMSPEQCRGDMIDARSDLYACGILLYQLVTGKLPFTGDSVVEVAMQHIREEPTPPSSLSPQIHRGLEATILKALGKWPAMRQQNAAELRAELVALLPELAGGPSRSGVAPALPRAYADGDPTSSERGPAAWMTQRPAADDLDTVTRRSAPDPAELRPAPDRPALRPPAAGSPVSSSPSPHAPTLAVAPEWPDRGPAPALPEAARPAAASPYSPGGPYGGYPQGGPGAYPPAAPYGGYPQGSPGAHPHAAPAPYAQPPAGAYPQAGYGHPQQAPGPMAYPDPRAMAPGQRPPGPMRRPSQRRGQEISVWVLVPIAIAIGIGAGILVFFLTQH